MLQNKIDRPNVIWVISAYNIILGIMSFSLIPFTMSMSQEFKDVEAPTIGTSSLVLGLIPIIILSIFYIISAIGLLKKKEWGRKCLLVSSVIQCLSGVQAAISSAISGSKGPVLTTYIMILISGWVFYYLNKKSVRSWISSRNN